MHKSYQSVLPTSNKLLQQKWDQKYYEEHRRMVRDQKPMVDTRPPKTFMHLHLKLKKLQLEEERLATIERDNRILLEKMSYIMRTKGRVDNKNDYEYKSLSKEKRMREMLRVARENQEILKRIMQRKPEYSHEEWERQWEENQRFMDSIATYPRDWWKEDKDQDKDKDSDKEKDKDKDKDKDKKAKRQNSDQESIRSSTQSLRSGKGTQEKKKQEQKKGQKKKEAKKEDGSKRKDEEKEEQKKEAQEEE